MPNTLLATESSGQLSRAREEKYKLDADSVPRYRFMSPSLPQQHCTTIDIIEHWSGVFGWCGRSNMRDSATRKTNTRTEGP
jgi:hypothetical protein